MTRGARPMRAELVEARTFDRFRRSGDAGVEFHSTRRTADLSGRTPANAWRAVVAVLRRARAAQRRRDQNRGPVARTLTAAICAVAGLMITLSAIHAQGSDLRPARSTDLVSLIQSESRR